MLLRYLVSDMVVGVGGISLCRSEMSTQPSEYLY